MPVEIRQIVTAICEGPNCASHHNGAAAAYTWDESKPAEIPDEVFRLVTLLSVDEKKHLFCSSLCAREWLETSYVVFRFPCDREGCRCRDGEPADTVPIRYLSVQGEQKNFCSAASCKNWLLLQYDPPKSPREKMEQAAKPIAPKAYVTTETASDPE